MGMVILSEFEILFKFLTPRSGASLDVKNCHGKITERVFRVDHAMALTLLISIFIALTGAVATVVTSGSWLLAGLAYVVFGMVGLLAVAVLRAQSDHDSQAIALPAH